jgi:hypothetical protein
VALKGLVLQVKDIYTIGRVTKLEAVNKKQKIIEITYIV